MKFLTVLLIALGITTAAAHHETYTQELYEWGDAYVYTVKHYDTAGNKNLSGYQNHGSGVWLDDTTMVTACHVPGWRKEVWASLNGHPEVNVDLVVEFCDQWKDQAVLSVVEGERRDRAPVVFGAIPHRGERVYIIGYPGDNPITVTTGWFVGKSVRDPTNGGVFDDDAQWVMTADAMGGNSGGAVVVIREGEIQLVGILVSGYPTGNITQMKSLERAKAWVALPH